MHLRDWRRGVLRPSVPDMKQLERISIDPQVRFGEPCIRGTRITLGVVLGFMAAGQLESALLADVPQLVRDDVLACFAFAAEREPRLLVVPAA